MKCAVFSTKPYDREFLTAANDGRHELTFFEARLREETALLAQGFDAVCVFVHDPVNAAVLAKLAAADCRLVALRCAGFNNVDLEAAKRLGITVVRVPAYSPEGVAEHACGLILSLNRQFHRAYIRVRERDFSLDGLIGFELHEKTVGVIGTGTIGRCFAQIMLGFGCRIVAYDKFENADLKARGVRYLPLEELLGASDIVSLHCPLLAETHHLINERTLALAKPGLMLINTSRGALIDTQAAIDGLRSGQIGALGLDVYEEEDEIFYENLSNTIVDNEKLMRLLTFPNVLITSHQAFFTREAMRQIAETTMLNLDTVQETGASPNALG